jgi:O-antigen ligase/tetratricopeptide (TPR) repeat protein
VSRALTALSRVVFLVTLCATPWAFGGRPLTAEFGLLCGLATSLALWLLSVIVGRSQVDSSAWSGWSTAAVWLSCGFLALAVWQLHGPGAALPIAQHYVGNGWTLPGESPWTLPAITGGTLDRGLTQLELTGFLWPLVALVLGAHLFGAPEYRAGFWLVLLINGAAFAIFGLVQKLTWNEMLYWSVPLRFGGQPFGAFVNRNHAADYLNLCLAAGAGLLWLGIRTSPGEWWFGSSRAREFPSEPRISTRTVVVTLGLAAVVLGVVGTLSRGGLLAGATALVCLLATSLGRRDRRQAATVLGLALGIGLTASVGAGVWQLAQGRLEQMWFDPFSSDGRWDHWRDMAVGFQDYWPTGAGLGTYRQAARPYQTHTRAAMYWNADNQYLEYLIEGGIVAAVLMVAAIIVAVMFCVRLFQADNPPRMDTADMPAVMLVLTISQGLQSLTDFGLEAPANAWTLGAILGALSGGWGWSSARTDLDSPVSRNLSPSRQVMACSLLIAVLAAIPLWELHARIDRWIQRMPLATATVTEPGRTLDVSAMLVDAERLAAEAPDHAELHLYWGELLVLRYRQQANRQLSSEPNAVRLSELTRWARTHPAALSALVREFESQGNRLNADLLRSTPMVVESLRPAIARFRRAAELSPYDPRPAWWLARLVDLEPQPPSPPEAPPRPSLQSERIRWLQRTILLSPANEPLLRELADSCRFPEEEHIAAICWKRLLQLDPLSDRRVLTAALRRASPDFLVEHVIGQQPAYLLTLAELLPSALERQRLVQRVREELKEKPLPRATGDSHFQLGRLAELAEDWEAAQTEYALAVEEQPFERNWRLAWLRCLEHRQQYREALSMIEASLRLFPGDPAFEEAYKRLIRKAEVPDDSSTTVEPAGSSTPDMQPAESKAPASSAPADSPR